MEILTNCFSNLQSLLNLIRRTIQIAQPHILMKHIFLLFISFIFLSDQLSAQQAVVSHNVFYMPQESKNNTFTPYLEMYWQVNPQSIAYKNDNEIWQGKIKTDIIIKNDTGIVKEDHYILQTTPVSSAIAAVNQKIIDLKRFVLNPGKYSLQLSLTDIIRNKDSYVYNDTFSIKPVKTVPAFSSIQLVDTIINSTEKTIFLRNDHQQIPLCSNFIDDRKKTIHFYAELYNTQTISKEKIPIILKAYISKKPFETATNNLTKEDTIQKNAVQISEGEFSVATLTSGNYYLNLVLVDNQNNTLSSQTQFFQLLNSNPVKTEEKETEKSNDTASLPTHFQAFNLNKTFVAKYTAPQIRAILKMLKPIANPVERANIDNFLKNPDEMYMRYFIYNFWLNRNKLEPEDAWKTYTEKIKEVNKLFGSSILPGYETDRGIIYIKYGRPTERNIVLNEDGALPYELWQYNQTEKVANAVFLFYKYGFVANDFKLLTSTMNGEIINRDWRSTLYTNGKSPNPDNSKAEQYLLNR